MEAQAHRQGDPDEQGGGRPVLSSQSWLWVGGVSIQSGHSPLNSVMEGQKTFPEQTEMGLGCGGECVCSASSPDGEWIQVAGNRSG